MMAQKVPEVDSVLSALRLTSKGKINYDRHWSKSKEDVERILDEISSDLHEVSLTNHDAASESRPPHRKSSKSKATASLATLLPPSLASPGAGSTPLKFFGVEPVIVEVNRSMERSLNKEPVEELESPEEEEEGPTPDILSLRHKRGPVFNYDTPGFLRKVANRPVCVRLEKLSSETLRLLHLPGSEGEEEEEGPSEEEEDEQLDQQAEKTERKIDEQVEALRERLRQEAEKRMVERRRSWQQHTKQLEDRARQTASREMDLLKRELQEEEQAIHQANQRCKEQAAEQELARQLAQQERDAHHLELIQLAKQQEDRIREEGERELRVHQQTLKLAGLEANLLRWLDQLQELGDSQPDKAQFTEASQQALAIPDQVRQTLHDMKKLVACGDAAETDWDQLSAWQDTLPGHVQAVTEDLAEQRARAAEEAERLRFAKQAEAEKQKEAEVQAAMQAEAERLSAGQSSTSALPPIPPEQPTEAHFPYEFHEIRQFKARYIADVDLSSDKKLKLELQQAVNTPLNAISAVSREHLRDKLTKLTQLLSGLTVEVKDVQVNAARHPSGVKFCMATLAKRIVKQGEDVISSNFEAAFAFASVAVALWHRFPDFGKLLHAYFYELCPFLGPHHPQRLAGQTDKEYYTALGYKYENEAIEKQDKYLKRMSGVAYLFAAMVVSHLPHDAAATPDQQLQHPFGPRYIWRFLAAILNMEPQADVTATVLLQVLMVSGHLMYQHYGVQFQKLLCLIQARFLPKLEAVKTDGGPTARLEAFLQAAIPAKTVPVPKGKLDDHFL